jgi:uncharacterized protein (TIGR02646 family)
MKRLTAPVLDATLLAKLQSRPAARQCKMWGNSGGHPKTFKNSLTAKLLTIQSKRCAYCCVHIAEKSPARDHIAPKESHPEFTFEPLNLVLACFHCNTECKGAYDTIVAKSAVYRKCTFSIIHPYLDTPGDHIQFIGSVNKILVQVINDSWKGENTVKMFRLASPEMTKQRAKDVLIDDDLDHLPGRWREGFEYLVHSKLKLKIRNT